MENLEHLYLSQLLLPLIPSAIVGIIARYTYNPYIFQIDISNYYNNSTCPGCCGNTPRISIWDKFWYPEAVQNYKKYLKKSSQYFGKLSLPVCFYCWNDNCEICNECGVPIYISLPEGSVFITILEKTTLVKKSVSENVCIYCKHSNKL